MPAPAHPYQGVRFAALAHRGGSLLPGSEGKENTLHAFRAAAALGYHFLETDLHVTRDGVLVVFHDDDTERLTGVPGTIEQRTLAEVEDLRVGGEPIPTLDELFEAFPTHAFNIDLKGHGTVEPLIRALARHRAGSRVLIDSFSQTRLSRFRHLTSGRIPTGIGQPGVVWSRWAPLLPRLIGSPGVAFQVPITHRLGPLEVTVATAKLVRAAHATGRVVHVWTVDDAATMTSLIDLGVDGIITDRPDILKQVLIERDLWEPHHD